GGDVLDAILEDEQHTVPATDAKVGEPTAERGGPRIELVIRQPGRAVDDRLGPGLTQRRAFEETGERHGTMRTLPLFLRSSTCCTAARVSFRANARSMTGTRRPAMTWSRTCWSSRLDPSVVPRIQRLTGDPWPRYVLSPVATAIE